jgi:hypothetical protein
MPIVCPPQSEIARIPGRDTNLRCSVGIAIPTRVGGIDMTKPAPQPHRPGAEALLGLLDLRPSVVRERSELSSSDDAVALGLAVAKVYSFASVDYPGAAQSLIFDRAGTTTVGAFIFDPGSSNSPATAFTLTRGAYQILNVPGSTSSFATGINESGLLVGVYQDLAGVLHGFEISGGTLSNVDFPGATATQVLGVNDAGQTAGNYIDAANVGHGFFSSGGTFKTIDFPGATSTAATGINNGGDIVGVWSDAAGSHGFLLQGGVFTPIDFPLATSTSAFGINDTGDIAGFYSDPAGNQRGFILAGSAFSTVEVAGAPGTQLTRIKNGGEVAGICTDALNEVHGFIGQ